jgi:hypothetical protein
MKMTIKKAEIMNYKKALAIVQLLFISWILSAQTISEKRSYTKSVPVNRETTMEVSNKYGTIQITSWNKDSAYIRAEVEAYAPNQTRIRKMLDGIDVNITETTHFIRAQTSFIQNINMLFEAFKGITGKFIDYDSRVQINYFINVPEYLNLKIENKYGDVYLENCYGNFSLSLSNGSFKANSLGKGSDIRLTFCDASINSVESGDINSSFSEIDLGTIGDLRINSVSSRFDLARSGKLNVESRRDKFYISEITSIEGDAYFTDFKIENLSGETDLTTKYGDLDISMIDPRFNTINIVSSFSDISLIFDNSASYNLEIRHLNTYLVIPDNISKTDKEVLNEEKKEYLTSGIVGRNPGNRITKINATRGSIYIK